jgi:cell division protein FtsI/penicillin-binding protein 2
MPSVRIKDHWREQRLFDQRSLICAVLMGLATFGLIARLFMLQVVRHDYYSDLSQGNRVRIEPIPAARGLILDRNGELIAGNQPAYQLELVPEEVPDLQKTLDALVQLNLLRADDVDEVERTIDSSRGFDSVPIRLRMSDEEVARFAVRRFLFPGLDIKTRETRWYPNGGLAVHALGYVGAISETDLKHIDRTAYNGTSLIGKLGVESAYEKQLHGVNGNREVLVNAQGRSVARQGAFVPELNNKSPIAGDDLLLSIDLNVQRVAESALAGHRGAVVALDPGNGDVIALVSLPGFDPSLFGRGITGPEYRELRDDIDRPLFNRALRGAYPSGSTIKPVLGLAALTDHTIAVDTKVFCNGVFSLPGSRHVWRADKAEPRGWLDLPEAIARSSDVYFYRLASTLGIDRIAAFLGPFRYGQPTGIDIRNGTQMECVNCTACINACDEVMGKIGRPRGLIRFASLDGIEKNAPIRVTPRILCNCLILLVLGAGLLTLLLTRSEVDVTLLRAPGALFEQTPDGKISNLYLLKLINKTHSDKAVELKLENIPGSLTVLGGQLNLPAEKQTEASVLVEIAPANLRSGTTPLVVRVYSAGNPIDKIKTIFIWPRR